MIYEGYVITSIEERLKEMTAEYPKLQAKVGSRGYGFKHVTKIIETYNN